MTRARVALVLCADLLLAVACAPGWETVDQVRGAVLGAGVIGQSPSDVERRLEALRFGEGRRLEVGSFQPDRTLIEAQLRDASGRPKNDYNVDITIHFNSAQRADSVEVFTSTGSPL